MNDNFSGMSCLMTIVLMYGSVASSLPKVGYIKSIDGWMLGCLAFIVAALLEIGMMFYWKRIHMDDKDFNFDTFATRFDRIARFVYLAGFILFAVLIFTVGAA